MRLLHRFHNEVPRHALYRRSSGGIDFGDHNKVGTNKSIGVLG